MLITLYGINNIGKSTQAKLLVENLKKHNISAYYLKYPVYTTEPSGSFINSVLRGGESQIIKEEELQMWFAINRYQFEMELKKLLQEYQVVIAEDYIGTSLAWGGAKGADISWLKALNSQLVQEDFAILIQGERTTESIEPGHIHENDHDLVAKVAQNLGQLAKENHWTIVERQANMYDTQKLILDIVLKQIN